MGTVTAEQARRLEGREATAVGLRPYRMRGACAELLARVEALQEAWRAGRVEPPIELDEDVVAALQPEGFRPEYLLFDLGEDYDPRDPSSWGGLGVGVGLGGLLFLVMGWREGSWGVAVAGLLMLIVGALFALLAFGGGEEAVEPGWDVAGLAGDVEGGATAAEPAASEERAGGGLVARRLELAATALRWLCEHRGGELPLLLFMDLAPPQESHFVEEADARPFGWHRGPGPTLVARQQAVLALEGEGAGWRLGLHDLFARPARRAGDESSEASPEAAETLRASRLEWRFRSASWDPGEAEARLEALRRLGPPRGSGLSWLRARVVGGELLLEAGIGGVRPLAPAGLEALLRWLAPGGRPG